MNFCDELVVAIGYNPAKQTMFSVEERISQINKVLDSDPLLGKNIATSFQGLLVNYAQEIEADILIRGIRSVSDFEYEINLANINKTLAPALETVFLPTSPELAVVSSSMVKEIAKLGGSYEQFVPKHIVRAINDKFGFIKLGK